MRLEMMVMVMLVVCTALVTAKPYFQSKRPQCKAGQSWPNGNGCCTCRDDRLSYVCTTRPCEFLQKKVDLGVFNSDATEVPVQKRMAVHSNSQDEFQALQELAFSSTDHAVSSTDHGQWIPYDISGHVWS